MIRQPAADAPAAIGTGQSLFVAIWNDGDQERVRYFTDEAETRAFLAANAPEDAFSAIGAWGDLDWEDFLNWMDQRKLEETISPPADDLDFD